MKTWIKVVLIFLVIFLLIIGGYFSYKKIKSMMYREKIVDENLCFQECVLLVFPESEGEIDSSALYQFVSNASFNCRLQCFSGLYENYYDDKLKSLSPYCLTISENVMEEDSFESKNKQYKTYLECMNNEFKKLKKD